MLTYTKPYAIQNFPFFFSLFMYLCVGVQRIDWHTKNHSVLWILLNIRLTWIKLRKKKNNSTNKILFKYSHEYLAFLFLMLIYVSFPATTTTITSSFSHFFFFFFPLVFGIKRWNMLNIRQSVYLLGADWTQIVDGRQQRQLNEGKKKSKLTTFYFIYIIYIYPLFLSFT